MTNTFITFLATIDPISTLAIFVGVTAQCSEQQRRKVALRSVGMATAILLVFLVLGQLLLEAMGISLVAFQVAGGVVFFLFGLQMIFGSGEGVHVEPEAGHDPAVFPLAVPSMASPGSILAAVVLTDNDRYSISSQAVSALLLLAVLAITLGILFLANPIHRLIGKSGGNLLVRILGLLLAALATEMVIEALQQLPIEVSN